MLEFFAEHFSQISFLAVLFVAMIPTFESKIAIPFALSTQIWQENVLSPMGALFVSYLGTLVPTFLIIVFSKFIKKKASGFVYDKLTVLIERRAKETSNKMNLKKSALKKCLMIIAFVAVPLPLTGVYTGGLIAGFSDLKVWQGFLSVAIGSFLTCLAVLMLCLFFENSSFYLLVVSLVLIVVLILLNFVMYLINKFKQKKEKR